MLVVELHQLWDSISFNVDINCVQKDELCISMGMCMWVMLCCDMVINTKSKQINNLGMSVGALMRGITAETKRQPVMIIFKLG